MDDFSFKGGGALPKNSYKPSGIIIFPVIKNYWYSIKIFVENLVPYYITTQSYQDTVIMTTMFYKRK